MPISKNNRKKKKTNNNRNRTPLNKHKLEGKTLSPPLSSLINDEKTVLSSWAYERLPDMLWAAIIRVTNDQDSAIEEFKRILMFIGSHKNKDKLYDITLTGIAKLDEKLRDELINYIVQNQSTASALSVLLLFDSLPAHDTWKKYLSSYIPDINILMAAVGASYHHQSQETTDCKWFRLMAPIICEQSHFPKNKQELRQKLIDYPCEGSEEDIRPMIRAMEGGLSMNPFIDEKETDWSKSFWTEGWLHTPCLSLTDDTKVNIDPVQVQITRSQVTKVIENLQIHWENTHTTTAIDAKHDAVFGISFYVLRVLDELLGIGIGSGILGRLGLRTILETYINFHYLLSKDDAELWKKWRVYGCWSS
ncbi:hypothetical protein [Candidatus Albibeggiatoa sp. nov. BB20]|uniref:hypothetical protein n=1 Tax=Candidatus Albibeggiatoa sp. nov. BB20 TaxID=3162723 RepID=UPI0033653918